MSIFKRSRLSVFLFTLCLSLVLLLSGRGFINIADADTNLPKSPAIIAENSSNKDVNKTVLSNGLTILTKEVHTAPVVTVQIWYKIGSLNEEPGVNGIAHQLEHMLFKGTKERPIQFGRLFSALGSESNAFTSFDKTAYYGTVERNKLQALLVLESDRMKNAIIGTSQLNSEKKVVLSEIQGYENSPSYRLSRVVMRSAFPNHPYGLSIGGTKAEIEQFSPEKVNEYYRNYYSPDNAVLVIVGDFQTEQTLTSVKEMFGNIPKTDIKRKSPPILSEKLPSKTAPKPIILQQPGSSYLIQAVYPGVSVNNSDMPLLDVMDYILTSGRSSRVYQGLVETGLASNAGGGSVNLMAGGWYQFSAVAAQGKKLVDIEKTWNKIINDIQTKPVTTEELNRAKTKLKASLILDNRDIVSQANNIANDQLIVGDYNFQSRYLAEVEKVTKTDVQRVAKKYLDAKKATIGYFEPTEIKPGNDSNSAGNQKTEHFNLGEPVDPAELAKYLPKVEETNITNNQELAETITMKNGLKVLLIKDNSTPTVTINGYIQGGTDFDSKERPGIASLTSQNMMNGTKNKKAITIATILENKGAGLSFGANREGVRFGGYALNSDLQTMIEVLGDVLKNPAFPQDKLELTRQRALLGLKQELDSPSSLARRTFQQTVYPGNHPLYAFPTSESLKAITRDDVTKFYQQNYRPDTTLLTIMGDFEKAKLVSLLETNLSDWKVSGKPASLNNAKIGLPEKTIQINKVISGKTQSVTLMGYQGIDRSDSRYYATMILNHILGGDTLSSRLGTEIRDRMGLTYGIYSAFQAGKYAGPFLISIQTAPQDTQRAIASTIDVLKQVVKEGVTESEVRNAQRSITSNYTVELADPDSLASNILMTEVYNLSPEELHQFPDKIKAVTTEQVNQAAKELLHPDNLVIITAGPGVK